MKTTTLQKAAGIHFITIVLTLGLSSGLKSAQAGELDLFKAVENWQKNRLFKPTREQRSHEHQGDVVIYDSLTDTMVEKAMTENFERIQNMMFTRIILTGKDGQPKRNKDGEVITVDDGC